MTSLYSSITYDDYLEHYGIKGMKWGIRKDRETKGNNQKKIERAEKKAEKREAKASKFDAKAAKLDTKVSDLKKEIAETPSGIRARIVYKQLKSTKKTQEKLKKEAKAVRDGKLTSNQKKAIAGGVAVASIVAAGYMYTKVETGETNAMKLRGEAFLKGKNSIFNTNKEFARKDLSPEDVLNIVGKGVNPNYKKAGGRINCRRCTLTHELRRRGFDVTATTTVMGAGQSESGLINALTPKGRNVNSLKSLSSMVTGYGTDTRSTVRGDKRTDSAYRKSVKRLSFGNDPLISAFSDQPNGARGEVVLNFAKFGHSMAYEVFDGKTYLFDSQKGQSYEVNESGLNSLRNKWGTPSGAEITRLDNVELDHKFLARWATNSK